MKAVRWLAVVVVTAAVASAQEPRPPQQQPPPPPQQPIFRAEAAYVRVDAYVTQDGIPVEDLNAADFHVLEDGVAQRIETFERVKIGGALRTAPLTDPNSQREGNDRAADPRRRVFVLFLDTYHVNRLNSGRAGQALARFLDELLEPEDLVGVMKPDMDVDHLMLGHKSQVIRGGLASMADWGVGDDYTRLDATEQQYMICYPRALAIELIARRREKLSLDALRDLVRHLSTVREERKAIIVLSEGWFLFRPHQGLMSATGGVPGTPQIYVGPGGRLGMRDPHSPGGATPYECDSQRMLLANLDNEWYMRSIFDEANRTNATFYPVNAAGLVAPGDVQFGGSVAQTWAMLRQRQDTLMTLASATDGLAVVNTNDLVRGLRKVAADLSFYYLLGYHSTNTNLDGKFRSIKVRVTRPGVEVRARRGYRAATREELTAAISASPAVSPAAPAVPPALSAALGRLGQIRPDAKFRLHAIALRSGSGARLFVAGELEPESSRSAAWAQGADVTLIAETSGGGGGTGRAAIAPGGRGFLAPIAVDSVNGEIQVQARIRPRSPEGQAGGDVVVVRAPEGRAFLSDAPLLFRLAGGTGAAPQPAADFRFTRTERVRLELPASADAGGAAGRVLDRAGQPLAVPVTISERTDDRGTRWLVADVTLAPLYSGDYGIEIGVEHRGTRETMVTAVRVVR
jgi:VWFA-related protein